MKTILLVLSLFIVLSANATHIFVEFYDSDANGEIRFSYGYFERPNGKGIQKQFLSQKKERLNKVNLDDMTAFLQQELTQEKGDILLFFHAMLGNHLQRNYVKFLDDKFIQDKNAPFQHSISFIWHVPSLNYLSCHVGTKQLAQNYQVVFDEIIGIIQNQKEQTNFHLLCHSMGHQVFTHLIQAHLPQTSSNPLFENCFFFAADLDMDIFEQGKPLEYFPNVVATIYIFHREDDRLLKASYKRHKTDRLGRIGNQYHNPNPILHFINAKNYKTNSLSAALTKHTYFMSEEMVRFIQEKI